MISSYAGVQFLFEPSQAITIHQTAVYKCSVDNNGVGILWNVNGSSPNHPRIKTSGVGTQNSSLTIPGNPELNNTIVICTVFEFQSNGDLHIVNTSNATLFIQGMIY